MTNVPQMGRSPEQLAKLLDSIEAQARKIDLEFQDPFDQPDGPSDDCFSALRLVGMYENGASEDDLHHMARCTYCADKVLGFRRFASRADVPSPPSFWTWLKSLVGARPTVSSLGGEPALIALEHPRLVVAHRHGASPFVLKVMLYKAQLGDLDAASVRVLGSVRATNPKVSSIDDHWVRLHFNDVEVSSSAAEWVALGKPVHKSVFVTGVLGSNPANRFVGQARVELTA